jgi:cytidine deaminase
LVEDIVQRLRDAGLLAADSAAAARSALDGAMVLDVTEYGRAVHAEVAALLAAGRLGVSTSESTLYATTYPCHNCAKHIVAAGVGEVVYIEPYPKSRALELHGDAIAPGARKDDSDRRVLFRPFLGIGPRRFIDLFAMRSGGADPLIRKDKRTGDAKPWNPVEASVRLPLSPLSYLEREQAAQELLERVMDHVRAGREGGAAEEARH